MRGGTRYRAVLDVNGSGAGAAGSGRDAVQRRGALPRLWEKADQQDTTITSPRSLQPYQAVVKNGKKEDPGNYQLVSLNSVPGKTGQHILLGAISKHMKDKKVTGSSQQGFTKGQLHLTHLITFYNETAACVDNRRALDVVLIDCTIDFIKAFDMVSHSLLVGKLVRFGLDKWGVK
ncbi:hypothetical protein QYF61_015206 [Mycteria americana]|uniref:Reverse transcriptase n=1 Tax=Mycteria americana TaxID=33587 RepID=A0AAN7N5G2_MYCAM|nr:hypothetical protein QYF61_015206 [Mycteria americana]